MAESGLPEVMVPWENLRCILLDFLFLDCIITTSAADDIVGCSVYQHNGSDTIQWVYSSLSTIRNIDIAPAPFFIATDGIDSTFQTLINRGTKYEGHLNIKTVVPTDLGPNFGFGMAYPAFAPDGKSCFVGHWKRFLLLGHFYIRWY